MTAAPRKYRYNGLLKSHWSNPMKHLIPYLQDDQKAADDLRQVRWPDGVTCPRCGSDAVESRERCDNGLQRFNCMRSEERRVGKSVDIGGGRMIRKEKDKVRKRS